MSNRSDSIVASYIKRYWDIMNKKQQQESSEAAEREPVKVQEQETSEPSEAPDLMPEELAYLRHFFVDVLHTGSRVICSPPVLDTDDDWIVLCKDNTQLSQMEGFLKQSGFHKGGSKGYPDEKPEDGFHSWKKHQSAEYEGSILNVILTDSQEFFDKSSRATWLSRKLNLQEKEHRILVFRAIREGLFTDLPEKKNKNRYVRYNITTSSTTGINIAPGAVNLVGQDAAGVNIWEEAQPQVPNNVIEQMWNNQIWRQVVPGVNAVAVRGAA